MKNLMILILPIVSLSACTMQEEVTTIKDFEGYYSNSKGKEYLVNVQIITTGKVLQIIKLLENNSGDVIKEIPLEKVQYKDGLFYITNDFFITIIKGFEININNIFIGHKIAE